MRLITGITSTFVLAAASVAGAQVAVAAPQARSIHPAMVGLDNPRSVIGVTTSFGTGIRDTLGLLVSSVTRNGPAEAAGIEEGNRIAMINGVSLRIATADLGDPDMTQLMNRRLTRELDKVKPGDEIELRVYGNGGARSLKLRTADPDSLYQVNRGVTVRRMEERASLGVSLASTGSKRDTLGVFVMSVNEEGPAVKAGLEEGARIASINGVDLRVAREDAGDAFVSGTRLNRLERELGKVKPGDEVELRVYQNGQTRTVRAKTVSSAELRSSGSSRIINNGGGVTIIRSPGAMHVDVDGARVATTVARAMEEMARTTASRVEEVGRMLGSGRAVVRW